MKNHIQRRDLLKFAFTAIPGALALTSCGTLMYPERRGRTGGRLDSTVVIMDGLLCLLFILPGVIAFAVDFSTGAIYTSGHASNLDKHDVIGGTETDYNRVLATVIGKPIKLTDEAIKASTRTGKLSAEDLQLAIHATESKKVRFVMDAKGHIVRAEVA